MSTIIIDGTEIIRETTADLFNAALRLARESGRFAEIDPILDYAFDWHHEHELSNYEFDTRFCTNYGGSEGIYIDAFIDGRFNESGESGIHRIGTLKTLRRDLDAMELMGKACGLLTHFARQHIGQEFARYRPVKELQATIEHMKQQTLELQQMEVIRVDMKRLVKRFNEEYQLLYERNDNILGYRVMLKAAEDFLATHGSFVGNFAWCRGDYITSDREMAAFMFALYKTM